MQKLQLQKKIQLKSKSVNLRFKKKINNKIKNSKINIFFKVYFFSTIVIFLFATILFFNSIFWKTSQTRIFSKLDEIGIMYYSKLPYYFLNGIKGKFINTNIINLSINFKNYSILSDDAKNKLDAYKNNVIEWPIYNFREVPAELKLDNEKNKNKY